jgi:Zn-dependent protease
MTKIKFSKTEILHILASLTAIAIAFSIAYQINLFLGLLTAGLGFLLHELSHKMLAQHYRCFAEFRADFKMLVITVLLSFLGIVFAAPGAVIILGKAGMKKSEYGKIAAAGPLANIVLSLAFLGMFFALPGLKAFAGIGFMINSWLALFNLLPFGNFDGRKVLGWSKAAFFTMLFLSIALVGCYFIIMSASAA